MQARSVFGAGETHGILQQVGAQVSASSDGLGWTSAFASTQREQPFEARFHAHADCLMVLHRGGPVDMIYNTGRHAVSRHIPKGGVFFLPAGQECHVHLRGPLDTTHIYLRASLFERENGPIAALTGLAPLLGERDPVLEHLAGAVGTIIAEAAPSLAVDPIATALAGRFIDMNFRQRPAEPRRRYQLTGRQLRRVHDFVEANIGADIRLDAMARTCGVSPDHFLRTFKATAGVSPYQYVLTRRVERAKRLLTEEAGSSLADIAARCGFSHQEHLSRMFRRFTGSTPGRYRRDGS
ncbi:helix-turn-helix transcriptional regulator [Vineibacter terrae]|uniref:Helix-turn-helix transcriptional regulator n=1 Tax=Vineibacter terrae TaxID=2586908 RepID=A0A5C8PVZ2_9HYPH|nr:AraC family transcriptional regulator [Vineibacter terrae]TXL82040.1 helix-turn-helix transcriptional regulator [Vineibacter terrae]